MQVHFTTSATSQINVFMTYSNAWVKKDSIIFCWVMNEDNTLKGNTWEQIVFQYS